VVKETHLVEEIARGDREAFAGIYER